MYKVKCILEIKGKEVDVSRLFLKEALDYLKRDNKYRKYVGLDGIYEFKDFLEYRLIGKGRIKEFNVEVIEE